ncbi:MAG TPA: hypothetical protein VFH68_19530 [Polyangia bacterium]|jgi:hypothetical protein|nr:hypothetical protein [Polyangia bacterium]
MRTPPDDRSPPNTQGRIGQRAEQRADTRAERAARLLGAARALTPTVKVTLPEIQAAIRARRFTAMYSLGRLAIITAIALCPMLALASVALSRGWWAPRERAAATSISVPAGATARIARRARFDLALTGPSQLEIPGDDRPIRLEAGQLTLSNEAREDRTNQDRHEDRSQKGSARARIVEILTPGHRVEIAPASQVSIEVTPAGSLRVSALAGVAPRVDGAPARQPPLESLVPPAGAADARRPAGTTSAARAGAAAADLTPAPEAAHPYPRARPSQPAAETDEIAVVHDALERLRGARDGAASLQLLDEYERRFPHGTLRDETALIRIEALLALRRTGEALERLEALPTALLDRSPRLRVARGELRASSGHCRAALADFDAAATAGAGSEIERRIERGRAACNSGDARHTRDRGGNP